MFIASRVDVLKGGWAQILSKKEWKCYEVRDVDDFAYLVCDLFVAMACGD